MFSYFFLCEGENLFGLALPITGGAVTSQPFFPKKSEHQVE
jgi:hypothetical protein